MANRPHFACAAVAALLVSGSAPGETFLNDHQAGSQPDAGEVDVIQAFDTLLLGDPAWLEPAAPPTQSQIDILEQVFGNGVCFPLANYWVSPVQAISPYTFVVKRNLFFPDDKAETRSTHHLAHEFTHVWQQTRGGLTIPEVTREMLDAVVCEPGAGCHYDKSGYDIILDPDARFLDYGMEQQAEIVENFYLLWFEGTWNEHCLNCAVLGVEESLAVAESLVRQEIY